MIQWRDDASLSLLPTLDGGSVNVEVWNVQLKTQGLELPWFGSTGPNTVDLDNMTATINLSTGEVFMQGAGRIINAIVTDAGSQ